MNYDSTNVGAPIQDLAGFTMSPNPAGTTPWATPHVELYETTTGYDMAATWARARDSIPGCTALTISESPIPNGGTTCAPSVTFYNNVGKSTAYSVPTSTMTDTNVNWLPTQWVGDSLEFTSGSAAGLSELITASGAQSITVGTAFVNNPDNGGDNFIIVEPNVTVNNPIGGITTPGGVQDFVPIVITNNEPTATASGFQQMVTVNSNIYAQYEATNLQNVEFFTASGAALPSWLESGNSNTASSTTYWVNLGTDNVPAATAGGTLVSAVSTDTLGVSGTTTAGSSTTTIDATGVFGATNYAGDWLQITSAGADHLEAEPILNNNANSGERAERFHRRPRGGSHLPGRPGGHDDRAGGLGRFLDPQPVGGRLSRVHIGPRLG